MKTYAIFLLFIFVAGLSSNAQEAKKKNPRPNILILVIDDASWNLSPPNTPSYVHLPGFDSIRLKGATIESAFCNYSLCNPSRSGFLTSLYPHQSGAIDNNTAPNSKFKFFTESLHDAGYHVAVCGKLTNTIYTYQNWTDSNRWMATERDDYRNPTVYFTTGNPVTLKGYNISIVGDTSNKWLATIDTPFCFWEGVIVPHTPATPLPWTVGLFKNDYKPLTDFFPFTKDYPSFTYSDTFKYYLPNDSASVQQLIEQNYECYVDLDSTITVQLNTLKARGLLDNTFILLINDNGYENGEHLLRGKNRPYKESLGLPCYIRYKPWFSPNTVLSSFMFTSLDVGPTILDAARVKDKTYEKQQMGSSVEKLRKAKADSIFYYENIQLDGKVIDTIDPPSHRGVRTFNFNYVKYHCDSLTEELFDLRKDPGETQNVVREASYKKVLARFRNLLDSMSQATFDTISSDTFYQACRLISGVISPKLAVSDAPGDFFSISPNPVGSLLTIRWKDASRDGKPEDVSIYNSIGETVLPTSEFSVSADQINIDVHNLPDAIYFLRLVVNGQDHVQPFIVQHHE